MDIALIEYQHDIGEAGGSFPPGQSLYLSVSAESSYHLSRAGLSFLTDEDVLSPAEFMAIGDENFRLARTWTEQLEEAFQSRNPWVKEKGFAPFKWQFHRLKILMDAVRVRRALLGRLLDGEKPSLIGAPPPADSGDIHDHHLFFHKYDSLYGLLAQALAKSEGIGFVTWADATPTATPATGRSLLRLARATFPRALSSPRSLLSRARRHRTRTSTRANLLIGSLDYDIALMLEPLSKEFGLYHLQSPTAIRPLDSPKMTSRPTKPSPVSFDLDGLFEKTGPTGDPVVDEILNRRIQAYSERYLAHVWDSLDYMDSVDCQKDFKVYIHITGAFDAFSAIPVFQMSRKGRPTVIVQHGAYGSALNQLSVYGEFDHDGCFLAWGDGVGEMYETRKRSTCQIVTTGSPLIEVISKNARTRRTISSVCYVPGMYRGYTAHYTGGQPCLDSKLFLMETGFLSALKPFVDRYQITYKIAPGATGESPFFGQSPMLEWLEENAPEFKVEPRPLMSVLSDFDLFIIDWPTTTLLQALASGADLLVYVGSPYYRLSEAALRLLERRAVLGLDEDDFKNKIRCVLEKGTTGLDLEDTAFLKKYGTYLADGQSLSRMVDQVRALVPC